MHPSNETLNDYVDGTLTREAHAEVQQHLHVCADCALVVAELEHIIHEAASLPPLTPSADIWRRLNSRIEASSAPSGLTAQGKGQKARGLRAFVPSRRPFETPWRALATAALVVLAFLTGRLVEQRHVPEESQQAKVQRAQPVDAAASAQVRERVLLVAVGDHLERSQMVLVELANAQTSGELDISAEQQSADELIASNRLYRQTAADMGQANVADLLDELERVLVEVARGPSQVSMQQLAEIQQRIEAQGILFKVKIVGSEMRERGNSISAARKQPIS
jgi:anti-sigma factor RsiW